MRGWWDHVCCRGELQVCAGPRQVEHHSAVAVVVDEPVDLGKPEAVAVERHYFVKLRGLAGYSNLHVNLCWFDGWPVAFAAGRGRAAWGGLLDQDGAGVEQIEAATLRVLLRLGGRLGGDHGDVAPCCRGVGEPCRQQRGLDPAAAVRGRGRRAGELCDAVCAAPTGPTGDDPVAVCEVALDAGRHE